MNCIAQKICEKRWSLKSLEKIAKNELVPAALIEDNQEGRKLIGRILQFREGFGTRPASIFFVGVQVLFE